MAGPLFICQRENALFYLGIDDALVDLSQLLHVHLYDFAVIGDESVGFDLHVGSLGVDG